MTDYVVLFIRNGALHYEVITAKDEGVAINKVYEIYGNDIEIVDCWTEAVDDYIEWEG